MQMKKELHPLMRFIKKYLTGQRLWPEAHLSEQAGDNSLPSHNYHGPGSIRYSQRMEFSDYSGGSLGI
jgi:hypothetical protein